MVYLDNLPLREKMDQKQMCIVQQVGTSPEEVMLGNEAFKVRLSCNAVARIPGSQGTPPPPHSCQFPPTSK